MAAAKFNELRFSLSAPSLVEGTSIDRGVIDYVGFDVDKACSISIIQITERGAIENTPRCIRSFAHALSDYDRKWREWWRGWRMREREADYNHAMIHHKLTGKPFSVDTGSSSP